jgi:hypothetical protein
LQQDFPTGVRSYLQGFENGDGLDLVHLCCLARCWATLKQPAPDLFARINAAWDRNNIYHSFLAWGALQDLGHTPTAFSLRDASLAQTTPTTAAAGTLLRQMQSAVGVVCASEASRSENAVGVCPRSCSAPQARKLW